MDFHALLAQIQDLEHAQREEEAKLIREKLQHENTKTELEKSLLISFLLFTFSLVLC